MSGKITRFAWIFFLSAGLFLVLPTRMMAAGAGTAACPANQVITDFGCIPTDPVGFVGKFYSVGLGIIGGVSVMAIMYGGYLYLSSSGNQLMIEKGKRFIVYAIIGLLLVVFGFVFVQLVAVDVLHIPGFQ